MISIRDDQETIIINIQESLAQADPIVTEYNKNLIYEVITEKYTEQYIKRQRRINSLKSPFRKVRELLQEAIGENIEKVQPEEVIDLAPIEEDKKTTLEILTSLPYLDCLEYLKTTNKIGVKRANASWSRRISEN